MTPPPAAPTDAPPSTDERLWAMLAHLLTFAGWALIGAGNWIPPLVIWLAKKDQSAFVADQAKESLNFQVAVLVVLGIAALLNFVVLGACIGVPLMVAAVVADIVLVLVASMRAHEGVRYRYPVPRLIP